ncbi:Capsule polysaccharide biosynthesis protein [Roseimaritima multifibrata]|uniref:Capsule polysaccharide biosynthesis protein n=1 Tax=Roseimaritima multifibrata TaxID=1930274 RepID=A0A517MA17_9BACT|nr:hypothetical protein [Roseimaritima multifibrata]QDS91726.1 Capsule polysaccharide biosynthesis protein [Roseimaritima multifibrata]
MCSKSRINVLVCPFGDLNLLLFLFQELEAKFPGKYSPTFLSFTEYDRLVYRSFEYEHIHISPATRAGWFTESDLDEVCRFTIGLSRYHGTATPDDYFHSVANHYGYQISKVLCSKEYDHVVLFNGRMNLFIACLDKVAENEKLPRLIFEQGLFRPRWITLDGQGVNARNSIHSIEQLLSDEPFDYQRRELFKDISLLFPFERKRIPDFKRRVSKPGLFRAYISSKTQSRRNLFLRTAENKDFFDSTVFPRKVKQTRQPEIKLSELCEDRNHHFIFCPFQVETDTQIILHSPWISRMSEFADIMCDVADRLYAGGVPIRVLFKRHPMSATQVPISHPRADLIEDVPVDDILRRLKPLVVTINSTAGIEAIDAGLPVVTLGETFFNLPEVILGTCRDIDALTNLLSKFFLGKAKYSAFAGRQLMDAMRDKYQVLAYSDLPACFEEKGS